MASLLIRHIQNAFERLERGEGMPSDRDISKAVEGARSSSPITFNNDTFLWHLGRYDKLIAAERELQAGLSALEREGDFVRKEAESTANPPGLGWAAVAFAYLTVVGVVVPIFALAVRPVPSDPFSRSVLVGLFMSGLAALGVYLFWAIRQLTRPTEG